MTRIRLNLDALGVCASTLCMIHCVGLPLLLAALPLWSLSADTRDPNSASTSAGDLPTATCCVNGECFAEQEVVAAGTGDGDEGCTACCSTPVDFWIHAGLLATVAPLGLVAWGVGYWHHRRFGVLGVGIIGILFLSAAMLFGHHLLGGRGEQVMTVMGSICMVSAHLWNRRQCRCCRTPDLARVVEVESAPPSSAPLPATNGAVS